MVGLRPVFIITIQVSPKKHSAKKNISIKILQNYLKLY